VIRYEAIKIDFGVVQKLIRKHLFTIHYSLFSINKLLWMPDRDQVKRGLVGD
jgi:hypothetical protein